MIKVFAQQIHQGEALFKSCAARTALQQGDDNNKTPQRFKPSQRRLLMSGCKPGLPTRSAFGNPCFIIEPSERTNERSEFDVVRPGQAERQHSQVAMNGVSSGAALKEGLPNAESGGETANERPVSAQR